MHLMTFVKKGNVITSNFFLLFLNIHCTNFSMFLRGIVFIAVGILNWS